MGVRFIISGICAIVLSAFVSPALAQFEGRLEFSNPGCEATRDCRLKYPLRFIDANRTIWQADAGDITDGASIPTWAQPFIGPPYHPSYLKAAVLHDHYCKRKVYEWKDTHRMFYEALRVQGLGLAKAKIMYYAVLIGNKKWINLMAPKSCSRKPGEICINNSALRVVETIVQESRYDKLEMDKELAPVVKALEENPEMPLRDLERAALRRFPEDEFYNRGDQVVGEAASAGATR